MGDMSLCLSSQDASADVQYDLPRSFIMVGTFDLTSGEIFKLTFWGHGS